MNKPILPDDFFIESNSVDCITEADYEMAKPLIEIAKAFERSSYQCVYIIDYFKRKFFYVSDNISQLCGVNSEEVKNFGYFFYTNYVPSKDLEMLIEINHQGFKFFSSLPKENRTEYTISYNFHITSNKLMRTVNHKLTPLLLAPDGKIWLALCTISLAHNSQSGNVIIKKTGENKFYQYSFVEHKWVEHEECNLTYRERDVLSLAAQGFTMDEISKYRYRCVDTIKAVRTKLFKKLGVKNIASAIAYAQNHRLI